MSLTLGGAGLDDIRYTGELVSPTTIVGSMTGGIVGDINIDLHRQGFVT